MHILYIYSMVVCIPIISREQDDVMTELYSLCCSVCVCVGGVDLNYFLQVENHPLQHSVKLLPASSASWGCGESE